MKDDLAAGFIIEPLADQERSTFSSGVDALDRYLKQQAGQDARKHVAAPFLLVHRETCAVAGFYTLSSTAIEVGALPPKMAKKLPKYPLIPATLLGRLAVDQHFRGAGLGEFLLTDALLRSWRMSREIASFAVIVDAKDEGACVFYRKYGFMGFADQADRLFLPMQTIRTLF